MEKIAEGQATKIIIPSDMQGLVGMASPSGVDREASQETRPAPEKK
ncbi:MAG: hypothetical protein MZU84_07295 [Sphingobacterium sp.]|nr:hypothetical protein [Sphingobacterium sp.]